MKWFRNLSVVIVVFGTLIVAPSALAANFNLTTSPLPVLLSAKPGSSVSTDLRIQNSSTAPATIKVELKKFKANGTTGSPEILSRGPGDSFFDWVRFSTTSFYAQPGQWTTIKMNIDVPPTAAFGYYYAVIFSQDTGGTSSKATQPGSKVNAGTAVLVLLNAQAPGEKQQLNVTKFSSVHKVYEYLPATFNVVVKNTGNIYTAPSGTIFIKKGKQTLAQLDINPGSGNILPGTSRSFSATWNDGFPVFKPKLVNGQVQTNKNGQQQMSLTWDFGHANHFRFGHYTAHLVAVYNNGTSDVPISGDVSFWVVPWKILPVIIVVVALVGVGLWTSLKSVRQRLNRSHKK